MKVINLRKLRSPRSVRSGWAATGLLAVSIAAGLSACSLPSSAPAALVSDQMTCPQATLALTNAQSALAAATDLVPEAGTPAEKTKADKVAAASADVDRLTAVKTKACEQGASSTPSSSPSATATASPTTSAPATCNNWAWQPDPHANFAWVSGGLKSIQDATTDAQAAAAASEWMGHIQLDPVTLQGAIKLLLEKDVPLSDLGNTACASDTAKSYVVQMYLALGKARVTPDVAPITGVNSGVANGTVYSSGQPTISGDRKAVRIDFVDQATGKVIRSVWVMARCGNGVTVLRVFVPSNPQEICESGPDKGQPVGSDGLCAKDPTQDPQSQGNVPGQSTKTGGSVDNGNEVGNGPVKPVDSGNGTGGTPPRATPSSAPTHSGGPTLPSPTEAPEPLPTPQPTQTASVPPPPPPPA